MKLLLTLTFALAGGAAANAQAPPAQNPPSEARPQQDQNSPSTKVTGCLTKGSDTGHYVITDSKSGEKFDFPASDKLESYVNHTVELTGKMMDQSGEKTFRPETIKTVSTSCERQ